LTEEIKSHLFAIRTTGGQEKVVMRLLEAKANAKQINIQSVFWVSDLKGYVVVEAVNPSDAYLAVEGVRHIRGQLRGELEFEDIEGYLIKKSTVSTLAVDSVVEITAGPFKGMKEQKTSRE
jgi:transcriptional antiterminator NusG